MPRRHQQNRKDAQAGVWIRIQDHSSRGMVNRMVAGYKSGESGPRAVNITSGTTLVTAIGIVIPTAPPKFSGRVACIKSIYFKNRSNQERVFSSASTRWRGSRKP